MENNTRPTQVERVLQYLQDFGSITRIQAMQDLGIMNIGARISELRQSGVAIKSTYIKCKNRYGEQTKYCKYTLIGKDSDNEND